MAAPIYLRGEHGLWVIDGAKFKADVVQIVEHGEKCKCMAFSEDGAVFAWANAEGVYIMDTNTMEATFDVPHPKVAALKFSPKGTILAFWHHYTVSREGGGGIPNLHLVDVKTGTVKKSLFQKSQIDWAPEWSADEEICVRTVNNELQCYEKNHFETIANKLHIQKVAAFSLAPNSCPYIIAVYVPGAKGQPSFVRVYRYPNFGGQESAIATKSFFKADRVNFFWNKPGNSLLVLTSTESSASSYYGDQGLHFLSTSGDSCLVPLQKQGPIYHVEWVPNNVEFVVMHGYMPAKTTIYNLKCEPVFDFGTGPRNVCSFNPQGTILCLAGFGNLAGNLEFWDMKNRRQISKTQAADTTHFEWCPDGQHILTATLAPRLRIGNGYRIWHYSGTLMLDHPIPEQGHLWQACYQPQPADKFPAFAVSTKPVVSSEASQPKAQTAAYRPPHARSQGAAPQALRPLQEYEPPSNVKKADPEKGPGKNKRRRDAKKAKAALAQKEAGEPSSSAPGGAGGATAAEEIDFVSTGDPEKDKRLKNLKKKLQQIEKLKEQEAGGKVLEKNQIEKIKTLEKVMQEIEDLEVS